MSNSSEIYIGLMSGTSMDGVDAALVDVKSNRCLEGITMPYSAETREWLKNVLRAKTVELGTLSQLNTQLGIEFANATQRLLEKASFPAHHVKAIGSHGQTLCHDAMAHIPYTVQLACPHTIAERTGIQVVADFRTRDIVVGGMGAPFAPMYHQTLFSSLSEPMAVINIGGIANISFVTSNGSFFGYDIGPGNCLMDAWVEQCLGSAYDYDGNWAKTGNVIQPLLEELMSCPYFKYTAPKSIGKEYFSLDWLVPKLHAHYASQDVQATLVELTVQTIRSAVINLKENVSKVALCGGGVHNSALFQGIKQSLPSHAVVSTAALGVSPDYLEAMMFAWLADKTLSGTAMDLSSLTGAKKSVILGAIYPVYRENGSNHAL